MALALDRPTSVEDLYLDRCQPIEPWRPIMQGDVFTGVTLHDLEQHELVAIVSHPCSMRGRHGALLPRLQAVPVRARDAIGLDQWVTGFVRFMPLPELIQNDDRFYAGFLSEIGTVRASDLNLANRIASLSELGVLLLQQRFIANLARVTVRLATLDAASAAVLIEAELMEDWLEALAKSRMENGEDQAVALAGETQAFDDFLAAGGAGSLRGQLAENATRSAVRRTVRAEIQRRASEIQ